MPEIGSSYLQFTWISIGSPVVSEPDPLEIPLTREWDGLPQWTFLCSPQTATPGARRCRELVAEYSDEQSRDTHPQIFQRIDCTWPSAIRPGWERIIHEHS